MSKVVSIQKNQSNSLLPVKTETTEENPFAQADFTEAYGSKTDLVLLELLRMFYKHFKRSQEYEYLSFGQKVDLEFKYEVLRRVIQTYKG